MTATAVQDRLHQYTQMFITRGADPALAMQEATKMLDRLVRREAYIQAYNDTFFLLAIVIGIRVFAVMSLKRKASQGESHAH
ncbi:MAG: hypothetical protein K2X93_27645 [Candidatus Obscuribacterales bacterium]|nr:hypothetical protein [Candidatus Obscuribacterales bacterium]